MVILNTRFTVLAASCGLSGLALGPIAAHAAAVHSPNFQENFVQTPFLVSRSAPTPPEKTRQEKRHFRCKGGLLDLEILDSIGIAVGSNPCKDHHERRSSVLIPNQDGATYYVASSQRSLPQAEQRVLKHEGLSARAEDRRPGRVNVLTHDDTSGADKQIASLLVQHQTDSTYTIVASETDFTRMYLVDSASGSGNPPGTVTLEVAVPTSHCVVYDPGNASSLKAQPCTKVDQPHGSQRFEFNKTTGVLRPFSDGSATSAGDSTPSSNAPAAGTRSVDLDDRDNTSIELDNVTLIFVADSEAQSAIVQEAVVEPNGVVTSTTTVTTTITATGSPMPSASAQGASATPAALAASNAPSKPAANQFKVEVVGPADSDSSTPDTASEPASRPTTSVNAEQVASRIAVAGAQAQNTPAPTPGNKDATSPSTKPTPAALAASLEEPTMASDQPSMAASVASDSAGSSSIPSSVAPTPAALAATGDSTSSSLAAAPTPAASDPQETSSSSSEAAPAAKVTPLNVLMEAN